MIQDVNDGFKPVPLYNIELSSGLVSGPVTVGIVPKLPMRGISMLLGNDLAGGKVFPSPVVCDIPEVSSETEELENEIPGIFPSCVVTRAQAMKKKEEEDDNDGEVNLGDTFFGMLDEGQDDQIHGKPIFSQPALIEAQKAAEDLKKLFDVALPAGEAEKGVTVLLHKR